MELTDEQYKIKVNGEAWNLIHRLKSQEISLNQEWSSFLEGEGIEIIEGGK